MVDSYEIVFPYVKGEGAYVFRTMHEIEIGLAQASSQG